MALLERDILEPRRMHQITRHEYHQMDEILGDLRTELIEGVIVEMTAPTIEHSFASRDLYNILFSLFGHDNYVNIEAGIILSDISEPIPDVVVARECDAYYKSLKRHPIASELCLVAEVSNTSLYKDRSRKASLYANYGIPEYWIVDITGSRLEVRRFPDGDVYRSTVIYKPGDTLEVLFAPGKPIAVSAFLA